MGLFDSSSKERTLGWKPARQFLENEFMPQLKDFESNFGAGQGLYDGSRLAEQDPNVGAAQDALLAQVPALQEQLGGVTNAVEGFLNYDPNSAANQARRDALSANVTAMFNESIRPGVENRGTFAGQFGGPQQNLALGAATAPLSRAIADAEVDMMNADEQRKFQAMGIAPSLFTQAATAPSMLQMGVGDQRTQRSQAELMDMIMQSESPYRNQLEAMAATQGLSLPLLQAGSTTKSSKSGSPFQAALGVASLATGMGAFSGLGSLFGGAAGGGLGGGFGATMPQISSGLDYLGVF